MIDVCEYWGDVRLPGHPVYAAESAVRMMTAKATLTWQVETIRKIMINQTNIINKTMAIMLHSSSFLEVSCFRNRQPAINCTYSNKHQ